MGQTTAQRKIKTLEKQVTDLQDSVKSKESWNNYIEQQKNRYQNEVEETHKVLNLMGVPQKDLPLPSRLTLLMTMIGMRGVIQLQKQEDNDD